MSGARIVALVKANGWAVNLLFILIGSYFVAGAANSVVARGIRVVPSALAATSSGPSRAVGPNKGGSVDYLAMAARNLFGAKREEIHPVLEAPIDSDEIAMDLDFVETELRKCTVPASLRATLVAEDAPDWSMAVVYSTTTRETAVYSINEGFNKITDDATLIEVRSREIIVRRRDHFERCLAEGEGGAAAKGAPARPRPSTRTARVGSADTEGAVQKTGDNEWAITREYLETEVLDNLSKVATQARIVPSFKNGKPNGFKLFSIKPRSIYSKIGLQNGDVIHKINGYEMNSPDKALEIYQKLREASSVTVELTRRGQTTTHSYQITN